MSMRAFTFIEILIAISIITTLSSVILNSAFKTQDRADIVIARSALSEASVHASAYYQKHRNYSNLCSDSKIISTLDTQNGVADPTISCSSTVSSFIIQKSFNDTSSYCVDSEGHSGIVTSASTEIL
ncbi:MAG: prepilin-type N-terminal cleavage/methylation domain-containing protein, partial [Alphaproteobacteria bacterium]|nr:prepilin-type N-terminal cleavage/methylation domain-containing protein [Alphaproteobacteria bacterium]